jgi:hypothetical protein
VLASSRACEASHATRGLLYLISSIVLLFLVWLRLVEVSSPMIDLQTTSHRKLDFITMTIYHLAHGVNYGVLQDVFGISPARISEALPIVLRGLIAG